MRNIRKFEFWGVIVIFILMSILHFLYEFTDIKFFTPFSAVNESVWEHLKIGFFAAFFYAIFEYFIGFKNYPNFIFAKAISLLSLPILITIMFYSYTCVLGKNVLWVDILIAFLSIIISQWISFSLITSSKDFSSYTLVANLLIVFLVFIFILFTYYPPNCSIFIDSSKQTSYTLL
ncbi:DUF6512 family protein [Clostridium aestuarii]|uniref:DUF6512 family protein n=1 Tax=Clostridium aestuarii TaxID=338193 RepID=UPI00227B55A3|nr:DUF6512 family protein [Clostridium aestuarii]